MKFKHSCEAAADSRCARLVSDLGYAGYGIYWGLIEILLQSGEQTIPVSSIPQIAKRFHVQKRTLTRVIKDFDLFEPTDDGCSYRSNPKNIYLASESE